MNFFISEAMAEAPAAAGAQCSFFTLIMLGGLFVAFYFILIRPQSKRAKEHRAMISAIAKGDEVVTTGGVLGRISSLSEAFISLEVASGVEMKVQRQAIQSVLPKGTIKSA